MQFLGGNDDYIYTPSWLSTGEHSLYSYTRSDSAPQGYTNDISYGLSWLPETLGLKFSSQTLVIWLRNFQQARRAE